MSLALVLAGGGVGAIAWELGVLRGLADADAELAETIIGADTVIGTSAGACVAAQITGGTPLDSLYEAQLCATTSEIGLELDLSDFIGRFNLAIAGAANETDRRRRIGAFAMAAATVAERERLEVIAARLPTAIWPSRDLRIPAVDATTGKDVIFTHRSGVPLLDAVAASCAVPGIWPPVSVGDRHYLDGGVRSSTNVDLAAGADQILLITPTIPGSPAPSLGGDLNTELGALNSSGLEIIHADQNSISAVGNPLSTDTRAQAARAGRSIGRAAVDRAARLLGSGA